MFKLFHSKKNYLNSNDLIIKGMQKRRSLAKSAILNIRDRKSEIRVVK